MNARSRPFVYAIVGIAAAWLIAMGGYALADHLKMTVAKIRAYMAGTDFAHLSGDARARALHRLEDIINGLSPEERRNARMGKLWGDWFGEMTEAEKSEFLDATLPSGFKQMLGAFEKMPEEKRHRAITNAIAGLKQAREESPEEFQKQNPKQTNGPVMSDALQQQVAVIGLKSVYSDSSAAAKAELAPLMEEIQKNMESGRMFRH